MSLFAIMYVWQNIEVMKIKMDYMELVRVEKQIIKENDRLIYEIEKYKTIKNIKNYAEERGMKEITPEDFDVLILKNRNGK